MIIPVHSLFGSKYMEVEPSHSLLIDSIKFNDIIMLSILLRENYLMSMVWE